MGHFKRCFQARPTKNTCSRKTSTKKWKATSRLMTRELPITTLIKHLKKGFTITCRINKQKIISTNLRIDNCRPTTYHQSTLSPTQLLSIYTVTTMTPKTMLKKPVYTWEMKNKKKKKCHKLLSQKILRNWTTPKANKWSKILKPAQEFPPLKLLRT